MENSGKGNCAKRLTANSNRNWPLKWWMKEMRHTFQMAAVTVPKYSRITVLFILHYWNRTTCIQDCRWCQVYTFAPKDGASWWLSNKQFVIVNSLFFAGNWQPIVLWLKHADTVIADTDADTAWIRWYNSFPAFSFPWFAGRANIVFGLGEVMLILKSRQVLMDMS